MKLFRFAFATLAIASLCVVAGCGDDAATTPPATTPPADTTGDAQSQNNVSPSIADEDASVAAATEVNAVATTKVANYTVKGMV